MVLVDTVGAPDCITAMSGGTIVGTPDHTVMVSSGTMKEQGRTGVAQDPLAAVVAQPVAVGEGQVAPSSPLGPAGQQ